MSTTLNPVGAEVTRRGRLNENSQCAKILRVLQDARGEWVSMPALVLVSGSYNIHSRVDELRHVHGISIENETDVSVRPHVSRYRLVALVPGVSSENDQ